MVIFFRIFHGNVLIRFICENVRRETGQAEYRTQDQNTQKQYYHIRTNTIAW